MSDEHKVTQQGINFVAGWEGFKSCPYQDSGGVWTRGYGETEGIGPNSKCVEKDEAKDDLKRRLNKDYLPAVPRLNKMKQQERDAMASFAYNCGVGAVSDTNYSTLARRLKSEEGKTFDGRKEIYRDELKKWCKDAKGNTLEGLKKRREAEKKMACQGDYSGRP